LDEELASVLRASRREGNTISTIIRRFWDDGNVEPLTKNAPIRTTDAHVGIVTHITLSELHRRFDTVEVSNGFANRFLWVSACRDKQVALPEPMPENELLRIQERILDLIIQAKQRTRITLSLEAGELWEKHYPDVSREHPGLTGSVLDRAEAQVLRLSLLYCLLDGKDTVEVSHLKSALAFWKYCEKSALHIFGGSAGLSTLAKKISAILKAGEKSATELHRALGNNPRKEQIGAALGELIDLEYIGVRKQPSGGPKPISVYFVLDSRN